MGRTIEHSYDSATDTISWPRLLVSLPFLLFMLDDGLKYFLDFQGRTVDLKTLTLIEEPAAQTEEELVAAEDEFEKLLRESGE